MRAGALLLAVVIAGCEGTIVPTRNTPIVTPTNPIDPVTPSEDPPNVACDVSQYPNVRLETIAADFARDVFPAMQRTGVEGCVACHAPNMGRMFRVTSDGADTFHTAHQAGYFDDKPGSLLDRLTTTDKLARMPKDGKLWPKADVEAVARVQCMVKAYAGQGGTPPDEQFPMNLLTPYAGPAITTYDNSFINMVQLQGKVKAVFNDDWVRGGTNQYQANIGLFGGVDFTTRYNEARVATSEFLLGLDKLAPDVCAQAATARTGPFAGFDLAAPITDIAASQTFTFEAEGANVTRTNETGGTTGFGNPSAPGFLCYTNCIMAVNVSLPSQGTYQFVVRARADNSGTDGPKVEVKLDGTTLTTFTFTDQANYVDMTFSAPVASGGMHALSIAYINDYNNPPPISGDDRNITIDRFQLIGPSGGGGTARETAARGQLGQLYSRMLYRSATPAELNESYTLLKDLDAIVPLQEAWTGVCEALVRHPDFLFTAPPSVDSRTGMEKQRLLLVKLGLDLLGRPPTAAEFATFTSGASFSQMFDAFLGSPDFKTYYFGRMRLRTESSGSAVSDEPARLWTHLMLTGKPFFELLTADYQVDPQWAVVTRPKEHGKSGVLTMKGFIQGKQGLPHYNYAARVFTDFMGKVFEVPPEVFAQRGTATAASTVDPTSICFSCHQLLTPLSHQRLAWGDDGTYRTTDPDTMQPIDDSDRALVETYPFKGKGMEGFAATAIRKESFVRSILQSQHRLLMGRDLRVEEDERGLYKQLWDLTFATNGDLRALLKAIAMSPRYQREVGP